MMHIRYPALPFTMSFAMSFTVLPAAVAAVLISAGAAFAGDSAKDTPDDAMLEAGRDLFLNSQPACGICHELAEAGTDGTIAPNLDRLQPTEAEVRAALSEGPGAMPNYSEILTETEIAELAAYVSHVAGTD
ncbi:MAG: c-type cytochrome [Rhodobacterales bacterium]